MKNLKHLLILGLILHAGYSSAQAIPEEGRQTVDDILFLADVFAAPAASSAAYQATAGWFTSARALEEWKVDISLHGNALFVPKSKQEFSLNNSDFNVLRIGGGSNGALIPTAFGKKKSDVYYEGNIDGNDFQFDAIDGIDKEVVFYPFPQISLGLPYGTEVAVRALPEMSVSGSRFSSYGAAIKHNFSQYFRFNEEEDLQVAGIISYNLFDLKYNEFDPLVLDYAFNGASTNLITARIIDVSADMWMFKGVASKRYENFEIFGALGVVSSNFEYKLGGSGALLGYANEELKTIGGNETQFKGDIGFNLLFDRFKISTMATAGNYFNINMGLHFILN